MRSAQETLRPLDAVLGPTMLTPAPKVKDVQSGIPSRLTTRIANFLGLCAISVPCGFTPEGLPVGLQLIGKPFDEGTILRLAHAYEQAAEWCLRRPAGF
jgi:aspartyl-tRNA(Asn)/glutamyl-tRNA(Gln) amidotransferase subunit A